MTDEDVETWWRTAWIPVSSTFFFFFSPPLLFIHLFLSVSSALVADKTIWMAQPTRTSCLLSESPCPLLSPLFHKTVRFLTSGTVSRCVRTRWKKTKFEWGSWKLLAAYLTRVASDLLRRLYHALCGAIQAALTSLHVVWNRQWKKKHVFTQPTRLVEEIVE